VSRPITGPHSDSPRGQVVQLTSRSPAARRRWSHHSLRNLHRAADLDVSGEMTAAAPLAVRQRRQTTSTKIQPRSTAKGRLAGVFATRSRRARIAVRCYVC